MRMFMLKFEMARAVFQKLMTVMHTLCKTLSLCQVIHLWNSDRTDVGGPKETETAGKKPIILCSPEYHGQANKIVDRDLKHEAPP